jgi:hypothetical protein
MTGDTGKDFSISGGNVDHGHREKDIAIADESWGGLGGRAGR